MSPPYGEDMFQRIVGVHWPKKDEKEDDFFGFLFIDSAGVSASLTGEIWGKIADGFSANAVAFGGKKWVAATSDGMRVSENFGKTWGPVIGPPGQQLVYVQPSTVIADSPGAFYALNTDVEQGGGEVYSSFDGKSWGRVLNIPEMDFNIEGINGYQPEQLQSLGTTVVLTATEWTTVPTTATAFGSYTRAARYTGSGGAIGGPIVYGPAGSANTDQAGGGRANVGAGAAKDISTGTEYIAYLEAHGHLGVGTTTIAINGTPVKMATSTTPQVGGGPTTGSRLSGGTCMSAADGKVCYFAIETFFPADNGEISIGSDIILGIPAGAAGGYFLGNSCALAKAGNRSTVFCTVASAGGSGGLWVGSGGGWRNQIVSTGGAVGVGRIIK